MSRFASPEAENYLFVDGLEDRDTLMEVAMFLSRSWPNARVLRHSSASVTPDVLGSNLVVLGGPLNNHVTRDLMRALRVRLSYDINEEVAQFAAGGDPVTLRLERDPNGLIVTDIGYFGRFRNPFNRSRYVVFCQGYHTFGTLAAASVLADGSQALANRRWLQNELDLEDLADLETLQLAFSVDVLANRRIVVPRVSTAMVAHTM